MKMLNVKGSDIPYWDECNRNLYPWYKKGYWKRFYRKKFMKQRIKEDSE